MTICIICPNCHGTKYVSQPHKVTSYPCPVCGAHGWVDVKDIPNSTVSDIPSDQHDDKHDMRCDRVRELEAEIKELEAQHERDRTNLELLDLLLKTLNPLLRGYRNMSYLTLGKKMDYMCQDAIEFRRTHNYTG